MFKVQPVYFSAGVAPPTSGTFCASSWAGSFTVSADGLFTGAVGAAWSSVSQSSFLLLSLLLLFLGTLFSIHISASLPDDSKSTAARIWFPLLGPHFFKFDFWSLVFISAGQCPEFPSTSRFVEMSDNNSSPFSIYCNHILNYRIELRKSWKPVFYILK